MTDIDLDQHDDYPDTFSPRTRALADQLRDWALIPVHAGGSDCGHWDIYHLAADAPLPPWLHDVLDDAEFTLPEGPWPDFGRTESCIDWPAVIAAHPEILVPDRDMLAANLGASWESIVSAYRLLHDRAAEPRLDVSLSVQRDGRIAVEPIGLFADREVPAEIVTMVDDLLVAGGRPRLSLREPGEHGLWLLDG